MRHRRRRESLPGTDDDPLSSRRQNRSRQWAFVAPVPAPARAPRSLRSLHVAAHHGVAATIHPSFLSHTFRALSPGVRSPLSTQRSRQCPDPYHTPSGEPPDPSHHRDRVPERGAGRAAQQRQSGAASTKAVSQADIDKAMSAPTELTFWTGCRTSSRRSTSSSRSIRPSK